MLLSGLEFIEFYVLFKNIDIVVSPINTCSRVCLQLNNIILVEPFGYLSGPSYWQKMLEFIFFVCL